MKLSSFFKATGAAGERLDRLAFMRDLLEGQKQALQRRSKVLAVAAKALRIGSVDPKNRADLVAPAPAGATSVTA